MGSDRPNVTGIVVLTIGLTAIVLVGGWFVASKYFSQQTVAATHEAVPPSAAAPRRKPARAPRAQTQASANADTATANAPAAATAAPDEDARTQPATPPSIPGADGPRDAAAAPAPEEAGAPSAGSAATRAAAADSRGDARTIVEEAQRRAEAQFYRYDGLLQSFDVKERLTEKRWTFDREGSNGRSKAVLRFTAPAEVKGVALLILNHPERASDQWMWTPAIERDRRIALQDRSTRFFGTDFSFEDLEEHDVSQYDYTLVGTEVVDGADCWKIRMTPKATRASQYTTVIGWIRHDNYAYARVDNLVKTDVVRRLTYSGLEKIQGIWTARQLDMADLRHGTHTRLVLQEVTYNAPKKDDDFTLQSIRR